MVEHDVFKIKKEYDDFLAKKKELIETLQSLITAGKSQMSTFIVGSFTYLKIKLEILDAEARLATQKKYYESNLWSFNNIFIKEYEKQVKECETNFDVVYNKAKTIVDRNDIKAKNFDLLKKVLADYNNPDNDMRLKLLLFKALQSIL